MFGLKMANAAIPFQWVKKWPLWVEMFFFPWEKIFRLQAFAFFFPGTKWFVGKCYMVHMVYYLILSQQKPKGMIT